MSAPTSCRLFSPIFPPTSSINFPADCFHLFFANYFPSTFSHQFLPPIFPQIASIYFFADYFPSTSSANFFHQLPSTFLVTFSRRPLMVWEKNIRSLPKKSGEHQSENLLSYLCRNFLWLLVIGNRGGERLRKFIITKEMAKRKIKGCSNKNHPLVLGTARRHRDICSFVGQEEYGRHNHKNQTWTLGRNEFVNNSVHVPWRLSIFM